VFRTAKKFRVLWPAIAALLALIMCAWRAIQLENVAGSYTSCHSCFLLPTLGHDAWLLSLLFALLGLSSFAQRRWVRVFFGGLAALLLLACALDLALLRLFNR
jgi:hypothetical protein